MFQRNKRYDLIAKYIKALTALGATAQEFDAGESIMDELDMVAEKDRDVFTESTKPSHLSQFFQKGEKRFCSTIPVESDRSTVV